MNYELKDSGKRQEFETGAKRDVQEGKGRYDLLPQHALFRLARVFEEGAKKYDDDNWRKGIPLKRFIDSGLRHACKFAAGFRDEDHAVQAAWNFLCLVETQYMIEAGLLPKELDNLPNYIKTESKNKTGKVSSRKKAVRKRNVQKVLRKGSKRKKSKLRRTTKRKH